MKIMTKTNKEQLDKLLAKGYAFYGRVLPRHPYRDEDDESGGTGEAEFGFETHPLLANLPDGAASDLSSIINNLPPGDVEQMIADRQND
jgi:hypothetical protein